VADLDLGTASSGAVGAAGAAGLVLDGGLAAAVTAAAWPVARLGGTLPITGLSSGAAGGGFAELIGDLVIVHLAGAASGAGTAEASALLKLVAVAGSAAGRSWPALSMFAGMPGFSGVSAGRMTLVYAVLGVERAIAASAAGEAGGAGSLGWQQQVAGASDGAASAEADRLVCDVPLRGLCGAPGWERPQLAAAAAGASAAAGVGLAVSGVPNVELEG
jgi:hypothetical protein